MAERALRHNGQTAAPALVEARGIHKSYEGHPVLHGIDLKVGAGEVVALIGRSGSGKSSLLRILNGLVSMDAGQIDIDGLRLTAQDNAARTLRQLRSTVGMVFQKFNLFPHLTAGHNLMLAPQSVLGLGREEARVRALAMLERVGMADKFNAYPRHLSGGQQQRVAIARALAMSPKVLLCDEITSALDPELTGEVLDTVRQLAADGMTLIMATHEMAFAREVSDQLVFLHEGKVHESGAAEALFSDPQTAELRNFIGAMDRGRAARER